MKKISDYVNTDRAPVKHLQVRMTQEIYEKFTLALEAKDMTAQSILLAGILMFIEEFESEKKKAGR